MKKIIVLGIIFFNFSFLYAQNESDQKAVEKACLGYIEGFYEGDTLKLIQSLRPELHKYGYWQDAKTGKYRGSAMSFDQAKNYARQVKEKENFAKADAPKKVEILDIMPFIASAKVTAWWGVDYLLLSKKGDQWMIEQVLWQSPPKKNK